MASLRAGHLLALALLVVATRGDERTFDCSLRSLALEYAAVLQPSAGREQLQLIADALNGSPEFGTYNCGVAPPAGTPSRPTRRNAVEASRAAIAAAGTTLYVDAVAGSDANPGTESSPLRSIAAGVAAARAAPPGPRALVLRAGIFYLGAVDQGAATIELGAADSHLTIAAYPGETVWVSGALPLGALPWVRANASGNVWTAPLPATSVPLGVPGLRANGTRLIRARFPNADPELGFGSGLFPTAWLPPVPQPTPVVWTETAINRTDMNNGPGVQYYTLGIGGGCAAYDPPAGFWCSNATTRFDGFSAEPRWPSGLTAGKDVLPHAPYARPQGAVVHAWRNGHWFTLQHEVGGYDGDGNLTFSGGGFQGGEGEDASAEFYSALRRWAARLASPHARALPSPTLCS